MKLKAVGLVAALLFATQGEARAVNLTLNFSVLPSSQGWMFSSSGVAESSVFSIIPGNILHQDTIGVGPGHGANYQLWNQLIPDQPITLTFTARITDEEGVAIDYGAISAGIGLNNFAYGIALRPGEIRDLANNLLSSSFDTSVFHAYSLAITPSVGYSVSVDGVLIGSSAPITQFVSNYIYFGDGSNLNARGDFAALSVSQVSEPESLFLVALGLVAVAIRRQRAQPAKAPAKNCTLSAAS